MGVRHQGRQGAASECRYAVQIACGFAILCALHCIHQLEHCAACPWEEAGGSDEPQLCARALSGRHTSRTPARA